MYISSGYSSVGRALVIPVVEGSTHCCSLHAYQYRIDLELIVTVCLISFKSIFLLQVMQ